MIFNLLNLFKRKKPEMVKYGKERGSARARPVFNKKGQQEMEIEGEKYKFRGFPRMRVLMAPPLRTLKFLFKDILTKQLIKHVEECSVDMIPEEQMCEPVREIARVFDIMIEFETEDSGLAKVWQPGKKGMCHFLQEDDAYRFRFQLFFMLLDMKKMRLNKSDFYYFRGKGFPVDEVLKKYGKKGLFK